VVGEVAVRKQWIGICLLLAGAYGPLAAADELLNAPATEATSPWSWFGDLMLRYDRVRDIPRPVESDIHGGFGRARLGVLYDPIPNLEFGGAIKLAYASIPNEENRSYNLNERANDIALDQFFMRWHPNENTSVLVGKAVFPFELSPMVWDEDLRPIGLSGQTSFAIGDFDRLGFTAGYFAGDLPYGDDSRIGAVQAAYRWHEGAPTSGSVLLSYLDFSSLEQLTLQGLARTNRHVGIHLVSDYRLLDLQFVGRMHPGEWPLEARIDLLRNLGADNLRDGARGSIVLGDRRQPHGWEFGFAIQRIQRDAAMAAFNSDDWWFHSFAHGFMPWVGYGFDATWSVRLAGFHEQRDGVAVHTDRVLLDVNARW
jgi:hypothetical protein